MYDVLVFVHILSAMIWMGGGLVLSAVGRHALIKNGPQGIARIMAELEWADDWIFTPAPVLVLASGVTMVIISDAWAFSQAWVFVALGLIVIEAATGSKGLKRIKEVRDKGSDSPALAVAVAPDLRFSLFAGTIVGAIVVLMVFEPGL